LKPTRVVLCGGAQSPGDDNPLVLNLQGAHRNVTLRIGDISDAMSRNVPDALVDLLEIADYVFAADQATSRGGARDNGEGWRRSFRLHIPVRRPGVWCRPDVIQALTDLLSFLSDDDWAFVFSSLDNPPSVQLYLENVVPNFEADGVSMFSGGLDSLAGAVREAIVDKQKVVLVSHDSGTKRKPQIRDLAQNVAQRVAPGMVRHIAVHASKSDDVGREYTQRTRSFLYASLGATVASMLNRDRIRFYENGVTSLNLPIAPQVVGGRATRTTHPQSIRGFERLFSTLLDQPFLVESPFLWRTKGDVIRVIKDAECASLVARSVSCSKTVEATRLHTHCGRCSQCIDRRFATLAVGLSDEEDPPEMYKVDLLIGERVVGENRTMAESFLQRAAGLRSSSEIDFFTLYPEATRALLHVGLTADDAGRRIVELHKRHAEEVFAALAEGHRRYAREFQEGRLPDSCLLVLSVPERYRQASGDGTPTVPTFRREGDFWKIWFENEPISLKDSAGLRLISQLLENRGQSWHSAQLLALVAGQSAALPSGGAGEATDLASLQAYRSRLRDLEAELNENSGAGDPARELELRDEAHQLRQHLRFVTNVRGKPRAAADDAERARQTVSVAIRRAMTILSRKHPSLWRHLRKHLKSGVFCAYEPDPDVIWVTR